MRLTVNNIKFVKESICNGVTYAWYVAMKSNNVSDSHCYINYDENGRSCVRIYPANELPKTVQKFIANHERKEFDTDTLGANHFETFIYRA